jgi:glycine dehydrogenase
MVAATGFKSMDALIDATVPEAIRRKDGMHLGKYSNGMCESDFITYFKYVYFSFSSTFAFCKTIM